MAPTACLPLWPRLQDSHYAPDMIGSVLDFPVVTARPGACGRTDHLTDIVDAETRRRMMAGIGSRHTRPELAVRRALHARGFRYRLHGRDLPGKPDMVLRKYGAVLLVHGCFWHGHDCRLFRLPATRTAFWKAKIGRNRTRDGEVVVSLESAGWRCLTIWECAMRGTGRFDFDSLIDRIAAWLESDEQSSEISGLS